MAITISIAVYLARAQNQDDSLKLCIAGGDQIARDYE